MDLNLCNKHCHKHSNNHRKEIKASKRVGCFCCLRVFSSIKVKEWIDEDEQGIGQTALCPYCSVDCLIGDASNISTTLDLLKEMKSCSFNLD